ncbi:MAG: TonB-dependent receptor domain-containing protein [Bryobacteraceae bacterium]
MKIPCKLFAVCIGLCLIIGAVFAQVKSSAITGTVTDPSGALVPGASVTVQNEETNVAIETKTNAAGDYVVPYLPIGHYAVVVKAQGFQTYRRTGIMLDSAATMRADAIMTTGSVNTTIEVKADAIALQTENSTVQGAVNQQIIGDIPNINNNPLYYATLEAGVVPAPQMYNSHVLGVGFSDRQQMSAIRINGGPLGTSDLTLDGVSVQGAAWHETAVVPNRDALQEVRVVTNSFSADTGNAQGLIAMTTKSGTNQFHGGLNYRLRNEDLDANGLYNNQNDIARSKYRVNEYGGNVGGPVILPKIFNGKDKLFFFASYERLNHKDPDNVLAKVPTALERVGDFSATRVADNNGNPVPVVLFDPWSAQFYQGSNLIVQRSPYPVAGVVSNPDQYGEKMLAGYPGPNHTPSDAFGDNNYLFSGTTPTIRNSLNLRGDYRIGDKSSFYFSGGKSFGSSVQPNYWGASSPFGGYNWLPDLKDNNPYAAAGYTVTVNPTTVIDLRYGVTHINTQGGFPTAPSAVSYSDYGMPANVQSLVALPGNSPSVGNWSGNATNNANWTNLSDDGWDNKHEHQLNHAVNGSITHVLGKWTLKAGGEYRVYLGNWADIEFGTPAIGMWQGSASTGQFGDIYGNNDLTLIPNFSNRGIDAATALTGATGYELAGGTAAKPALAAKYAAFYTQNDWKVNDKLTINLGLRYEVQPGPTERYNQMSEIDLSVPNSYYTALNGVANPNPLATLGAVVFPGQNGYSRNLWNTQWNNISPRIGAAYRLRNSMVVRAGYGRIYVPSNTGFNANGNYYGTGPYSGAANWTPFGLTATNGIPIGRFEDPQDTQVIPGTGNMSAPSDYCCTAGWVNRASYLNGVTDQWNFFLERKFGSAWLVSAGYVGSHGHDLPWRNYPVQGTWSLSNATLQTWRNAWVASNGVTDPAQAQIANPAPSLIGYSGGGTISALTSELPYLALNGATYTATVGTSNYDALQIRAQHSYTNGLQLMLNYTWSKNTGLSGGVWNSTFAESQEGSSVAGNGGADYRNLNNDRGLLGYDTPNRFVGTLSYLLPTGKGKALDPHNAVLRAILGDWQLGSVVTLQSGMPWGPSCGTLNGRCDMVPGEATYVPKSDQHWYDGKTSVTLPDGRTITPAAYTYLLYNPDLFSQPMVQFPNGTNGVDQYTWGSTSGYEGWLRTPGFYNMNLTVNRIFKITERYRLEFLAEATNLLNATQIQPSAINTGVSPSVLADPSTGTKVGQNTNVNFGTLGMSLFDPRQVTLSMRLRF